MLISFENPSALAWLARLSSRPRYQPSRASCDDKTIQVILRHSNRADDQRVHQERHRICEVLPKIRTSQ